MFLDIQHSNSIFVDMWPANSMLLDVLELCFQTHSMFFGHVPSLLFRGISTVGHDPW